MSLPSTWAVMPLSPVGRERSVCTIPLLPNSKEFQDVRETMRRSDANKISSVKSISRVQNPQLYRAFMLKKSSMDKIRGNGGTEMQLFHGTTRASCNEINHHGFNRSFAGKNGKSIQGNSSVAFHI